jgi:hypothetical protein
LFRANAEYVRRRLGVVQLRDFRPMPAINHMPTPLPNLRARVRSSAHGFRRSTPGDLTRPPRQFQCAISHEKGIRRRSCYY